MPAKGKPSNNPHGRPKGTFNPIISEIREEIRKGISKNKIVEQMFIRLESIEDGYKYVQTAMNIIELVVPKLAAEQVQEEVETKKDLAEVLEMVYNKLNKTG